MALIKNGQPSAMRANYLAELVAERLTGVPAEKYVSGPMAWGSAMEDEARRAYCFERMVSAQRVGLVLHPKHSMAGASPDSYIGADGLLEIKCPNTAAHIETLTGRAPATKYLCQMQWQMACAGRRWCDFVSYDPRMPESMRLFIARVDRNDEHIAHLEREVFRFLEEVSGKVSELTKLYPTLEIAA